MRLVLIGLAGGFFSTLFGVGGGIVIVPLLLLFTDLGMRSAGATSLAAIGITAAAGTITYAFHGQLEPLYAVLIGFPAAVGAIGGAALQQRVPTRVLSLLFAALLVALAINLLVG